MIPWLIALPKPVRIAIVAVVGGLLFWGAWSLYIWQHDKAVVREDRAERRAVVTERELQSERRATRNDEARRVVRESRIDRLEEAREAAIVEEPEATQERVGPAVRAVLSELREQQAEADATP